MEASVRFEQMGEALVKAYPSIVKTILDEVIKASCHLSVPRSRRVGTLLVEFYDVCFQLLLVPDYRVETLAYLHQNKREILSHLEQEYFEHHMRSIFPNARLEDLSH